MTLLHTESLTEALQLIKDEDWTAPWRTYSIQGWCIEDALQQVTSGLANTASEYMGAYDVLSFAAGEDICEWERQPGRTQSDVEALFEGVLGGE